MTAKDPKVFSDRRTSGAFFIADSGEWPKEPLVRPEELDAPPSPSRDTPHEIMEPAGFFEKALARLEGSSRFAALGIRPGPARDDASPAIQISAIASASALLANRLEGFAGFSDSLTVSIILPGKGPEEAMGAADELLRALADTGSSNVFLGAAVFPQGVFTKSQALKNVEKALDHALFHGGGNLVFLDAVSLNVAADKLYQAGDMDGAVRELLHALVLDPENINVLNSLGVCHAVSGRNAEALARFTQAGGLAPADIMPVYNVGLIHLTENRPEEALAHFEKALALEPEVFEVLFQAGRASMDLGRTDEAISFFEKAATAKPESFAAQKMLGKALADADRAKDAVKVYEKALRIVGNDAESLSMISLLYVKLETNTEIAVSFARQSVELEPSNGLFHFRLARILEQVADRQEALAHYEEAMRLGYPVSEHLSRQGG
ncbi:MAG: tetratricopeptide repeat protein [Deltaproteobacteria bacterium]|nr:tetratricopeptide repeat protein [Deltaproteobacteria bacterium]